MITDTSSGATNCHNLSEMGTLLALRGGMARQQAKLTPVALDPRRFGTCSLIGCD
jgi:hypothetical protein